jgi:predicted lipid-binding transport protein (Tim44 family)
MRFTRFRPLLALCAIAATLAVTAVDADARSKVSSGSRGTRTFSAPAPTATTPNAARPMERTMTQPGQPGSTAATRPAAPQTAPAGGLFNRPGLMGGLLAGFLGAGLLGMLFGGGFMGGLGGIASFLGLLLQVGLVVGVAMLAWRWWQRRNQPAHAFAGGPSMRDAMTPNMTPNMASPSGQSRGALGGLGGLVGLGGSGASAGLGGGGAAATPANPDEIGTEPGDFDAFERILGEVQTAYGEEDLGKLRVLATPEMVSYFAEDLAANASRGVINKISDIKLLQGDLAEAWREGDTDYATVAMRYALDDRMVDRASGAMIEGGPDEATEVWTFRRERGGHWVLSGIQQT